MIFIDTNVAIYLRDLHPEICKRLVARGELPVIAFMTRIELENGVGSARADERRQLLDRMLLDVAVIELNAADIATYGLIIAALGHQRRLTIDRLIAAQALSRSATLITMNGRDFRDIPGLKLETWDAPTRLV